MGGNTGESVDMGTVLAAIRLASLSEVIAFPPEAGTRQLGPETRKLARMVVLALRSEDLVPESVSLTDEPSVAIQAVLGTTYVLFEVYADGDIVFLKRDADCEAELRQITLPEVRGLARTIVEELTVVA